MQSQEFLGLKDKDLRSQGLLVTEGNILTHRLLESNLEILGVFCLPRYAQEMEALCQGKGTLQILSEDQLSRVAGFSFHRGILAVARRPLLPGLRDYFSQGLPVNRLVLAPDLTDPENLGSIGRSLWALGWDALGISKSSCDPFSRFALKVSMGGFLQRPPLLLEGREDYDFLLEQGFTLLAAVLDPEAQDLKDFVPSGPLALAFGNEARGLQVPWRDPRMEGLRIPMHHGADSLNVAVAAGIFLHSLTCDLDQGKKT